MARIANVVKLMIRLFVHVCPITSAAHLVVDQNVWLVQNVVLTKLASTKNALIPVLESVAQMLSVE